MSSRGEKTRQKVIDAAIACMARSGIEGTTFQAIADIARISQPLVVYHLKSREGILSIIMDYLLEVSLKETQRALSSRGSSAESLIAYIDVSLKFFRSNPYIARIYILFYYQSSFRDDFQRMNDRLKLEATERLLGIIATGMGSGEFKVSDPATTAKMLHAYITGLLLNLATERSSDERDRLLVECLKQDCLRAVGYSGVD